MGMVARIRELLCGQGRDEEVKWMSDEERKEWELRSINSPLPEQETQQRGMAVVRGLQKGELLLIRREDNIDIDAALRRSRDKIEKALKLLDEPQGDVFTVLDTFNEVKRILRG